METTERAVISQSLLSSRLARAGLLIVLLILGGSGSARSDGSPAPSKPSSIQLRLQAAIAHFNAERFEEARSVFLEIYHEKQDPRLLFNLGSCYRRLNQIDKAIEYYEQFVQAVPQSPLVPEARAYLAELRAKQDANRTAADKEQNEIKLRIAEERAREAENVAKASEEARKKAEVELLQKAQESSKPIYRRAWFWGLIGGIAAAGIATGVGLGIWQRNKYPPEPMTDLPGQPVRF
jgi:tetratricopeptide (TPR) repeat protein